MSEFVTVFEIQKDPNYVFRGSWSKRDDGGITVSVGHIIDGKQQRGTLTDYKTEDEAKIFFYNKIRDDLNESHSAINAIISKITKKYHARMKKIEDQILPAVLKRYTELLGPLDQLTKESLDKSEKVIQKIRKKIQ